MIEFPRDLVQQAQGGDAQALASLLDRALTLARGLITQRGFGGETLEDLLQDVAVQVLSMLAATKYEDAFGPIVVAGITRVIATHYRRQRPVTYLTNAELENMAKLTTSARDVVELNELRLRFVSVLDSLPPLLHVVFVLWAHRHSIKEMAAIMRVSPRTARRHRREVVSEIIRGMWRNDVPPRVFRRLQL